MDLPDSETRCAIWRGVLEGVPQEGSLNIAKLSEATAGYSGAEVGIVLVHVNFMSCFLLLVLKIVHSSG